MTPQELNEFVVKTFQKCAKTIGEKNSDYNFDRNDALSNFRLCHRMGVASPTSGILVRMLDKVARICSLNASKGEVDESVEDTLDDLICYAVILKAMRGEECQSTQ